MSSAADKNLVPLPYHSKLRQDAIRMGSGPESNSDPVYKIQKFKWLSVQGIIMPWWGDIHI